MLTIGQLGAYCGATTRAIRLYHELGLLPEPARDPSGYRRYDADAVITLTRIRALAAAGVPLARVSELLDADAEHLAQEAARIDTDLRRRINQLQTARAGLSTLAHGPDALLPPGLAGHLERLRHIGIEDDGLRLERDTWILIAALYPEQYPSWLDDLGQLLGSPDVAILYRQIHQARTWDQDDPRLEKLAADTVRLAAQYQTDSPAIHPASPSDLRALTLLLDHTDHLSPAWTRLAAKNFP